MNSTRDHVEAAMVEIEDRMSAAGADPELRIAAMCLALDTTPDDLDLATEPIRMRYGREIQAGVLYGICVGLRAAERARTGKAAV